MTRFLISIIIALVHFLSFAQHSNVTIQIVQNNQYIQPLNTVYELESAPFSFVVKGNETEGFLVGATFDEDVYRSAMGEADLEVAWFEATGMAEELFNKKQKMFVSNDAPSYWYYTTVNDHRFDKGAKGDFQEWNAERTVATFDMIDVDKNMKVHKFKDSLFVYMYQPIYDEDYNLIDRILIFNAELKFSNK